MSNARVVPLAAVTVSEPGSSFHFLSQGVVAIFPFPLRGKSSGGSVE